MVSIVEAPVPSGPRWAGVSFVRALDGAIGLAAFAALALTIAEAFAPNFVARIDPTAVGSDGGQAYTFSPGWTTSWPYIVPSHPDAILTPGDVQVTEDGESIGTLQPDHALIRRDGGGRFNLWQGTLWFSPSDDTDPRSNGRTYDVEVRGRLAPSAATARTWSWGVLAALLLCRLGPAAARRTDRAGRALDRRLGLTRFAARIPLTFGRLYALAGAAALGGLAFGFVRRPMPLILGSDSVGYVGPGLVWAAGGDMTGQSVRDVGYPFLTLVAARLGSLSTLPKLQLAMVVAGVACLLGCLYLGVSHMAGRLRARRSLPGSVLAVAAALAPMAYVALLSGHDLFMLDIDSAMAEAPHLLPCAVALLLFVAALVARGARARLAMLALASLAAYASAMFKPHSLLVFALCASSFVLASARHWRGFGSPVVIATCAVCLACAVAIHRFDAKVTPPSQDFGPKTLFCNHLDVIDPVFGTATPDRRRLKVLVDKVLAEPRDWPVMGFNGDSCMYGSDFDAALLAVAHAEGVTPARWEQREFFEAVMRNPVGYARTVARQLWAYLSDPTNGMDASIRGALTDGDWQALERPGLQGVLPVDRSNALLDNWVPRDHPRFGAIVKAALRVVRGLFFPVTSGSTLLALVALIRLRGRADIRAEAVLLGTALFTLAFAATTVLAHTFDISRYATDLFPFSLLWWFLGVAYLGHLAALASLAVERKRSSGPAEARGTAEPATS